MVHILGINLPDNQLARFALTSIYGVGPHISHRLCARFQIHDRCRVKNLTPFQVTSLASFLSSPKTALPLQKYPLAPITFASRPASKSIQELQAELNAARVAQKQKKDERLLQLGKLPAAETTQTKRGTKVETKKSKDPLTELRIESELRREIRENIAHQRMIGSYVGRRHAMHLPVRGQNTQSNARTARKLNKVDRY
ncbi:S13-like H2TH domain-containing protein [Gymnopus androsaceus JB14]|uniref:S13-like H2TH domain-containing protein n=1 Tax=Gymnopus androsaceus JB14 TaxID=1447944 RepID=A0A6A4IM62_9AGAR|nr:S13-like H2TH domain-containing protein [Gymnopus androsaceus JB14]